MMMLKCDRNKIKEKENAIVQYFQQISEPITYSRKPDEVGDLYRHPMGSSSLLENTGPARDEFDIVEGTLALVAHVLGAWVDSWLVVPDGLGTLDQSGVNQAAAALGAQDILVDLLQIPAGVGLLEEECQDLSWVGGVGHCKRDLGGARGARGSVRGERIVCDVGTLRDWRCVRGVIGSWQVDG